MAHEKSSIPDGGTAFPTDYDRRGGGMSLRDWFAGQALVGLLAQETEEWGNESEVNARIAYRSADAMLAERQKEK